MKERYIIGKFVRKYKQSKNFTQETSNIWKQTQNTTIYLPDMVNNNRYTFQGKWYDKQEV